MVIGMIINDDDDDDDDEWSDDEKIKYTLTFTDITVWTGGFPVTMVVSGGGGVAIFIVHGL